MTSIGKMKNLHSQRMQDSKEPLDRDVAAFSCANVGKTSGSEDNAGTQRKMFCGNEVRAFVPDIPDKVPNTDLQEGHSQ